MTQDFDAVLFDMDGVLIDAKEWHYEALNQALKIFGFSINAIDHEIRFDGLSTKNKLQILINERVLPEKLHPIISAIKQDRTLRIAATNCFPKVSHLILLQRLRSLGLRTGLVTNSIRETTEFMMTYAGIINLMEVIVTNEDVKKTKPHPECYLKAMNDLGVSPSRTIVIEDGDYGVTAATKAGARVLKVSGLDDVNIELLSPFIKELSEK